MKSLFRTTASMIGQMIRARGADDDDPPGLLSRKLRFLVIANSHGASPEVFILITRRQGVDVDRR